MISCTFCNSYKKDLASKGTQGVESSTPAQMQAHAQEQTVQAGPSAQAETQQFQDDPSIDPGPPSDLESFDVLDTEEGSATTAANTIPFVYSSPTPEFLSPAPGTPQEEGVVYDQNGRPLPPGTTGVAGYQTSEEAFEGFRWGHIHWCWREGQDVSEE